MLRSVDNCQYKNNPIYHAMRPESESSRLSEINKRKKQVALWNQKLGDSVVVWDYHVILVLRAKVPVVDTVRSESGTNSVTGILNERIDGGRDEDNRSCVWTSWVYDFDSRLNMPCNIKGEVSLFFLRLCK